MNYIFLQFIRFDDHPEQRIRVESGNSIVRLTNPSSTQCCFFDEVMLFPVYNSKPLLRFYHETLGEEDEPLLIVADVPEEITSFQRKGISFEMGMVGILTHEEKEKRRRKDISYNRLQQKCYKLTDAIEKTMQILQ